MKVGTEGSFSSENFLVSICNAEIKTTQWVHIFCSKIRMLFPGLFVSLHYSLIATRQHR